MRVATVARGVGWSSVALLVLAAVIAALFAWAVATEAGLRQVWRLAQPVLPQGIEVQQVEGRIIGPLHLRGVHIDQPQLKLGVAQASLYWSPRNLLRGELAVHKLALSGVQYEQSVVADEAKPETGFELPESITLPLVVRVDEWRVDNASVVLPDRFPLVIDHARGAARLQGEQWRLRDVVAAGPAFEFSGKLRLRTRTPFAIDAAVAGYLQPADWPVLDLATTLQGDLQALAVDGTVRARNTDTGLSLKGLLHLLDEPRIDATLQWTQLYWPLQGAVAYRSGGGEVSLRGSIDEYRIAGRAEWLLEAQQQAGELVIAGEGNRNGVALNTLRVSGAPGDIQGSARVDWSPQLAAKLRLEGRGVNPGAIVEGWPGKLDIAVDGHVQQIDSRWHIDLQQLRAAGNLRGAPLDLRGRLQHTPVQTRFESLVLESAATRVTLNGDITDRFNVVWQIESADFAEHLTGIRGHVRGNGRLRGTREAPRITGKLDAGNVVAGNVRAAAMNVDADIDVGGHVPSRLRVESRALALDAVHIDTMSLVGQGTPRAHAMELDLQSNLGELAVALGGGFDQAFERWQFQLREMAVTLPQFPVLMLVPGSNRGVVARDKQSLERTCLRGAGGEVCAQLSAAPPGLESTFTIAGFSLAQLQPWLPPESQLDGMVDVSGEFRRVDGTNTASATMALKQVMVGGSGSRAELLPLLRFDDGTANVTMSAELISAELDLPLPDGGVAASLRLTGSGIDDAPRAMRGEVRARIGDLNFLRPLVPEISQITGSLDTHLKLGGTTASPVIDGEFELLAPTLSLVSPGLQITDFSLRGHGAGERVALSLAANSGGGSLAGNGELTFAEGRRDLSFALTGNEFELLNTRAGRVWVSPDLDIKVAETRIDVTGKVRVPRADITPERLPVARGAVTVSSDQVIISEGDTPAPSVLAQNIHTAVRVIIGDPKLKVDELAARGRNFDDVLRQLPARRVNVEGFGLRGVVVGNLMLTQSPGEPALGSGELRIVTGRYQAYGQDLTIQDGRIVFAGGPVTEPGLNIRAVRHPAPGIMAGVHVRGRLTEPDVKLISDPPMTQTEQVSWLVLGRAPGASTAEETDLMTRAALMLGTKGGNYLGQNFGSKVGLDEVGIESGATASDAAFVVGKYLTPKLVVSYGIGLFEPVSTLRMRYRLSPSWQLESQSSAQSAGGDIIYSVETGD